METVKDEREEDEGSSGSELRAKEGQIERKKMEVRERERKLNWEDSRRRTKRLAAIKDDEEITPPPPINPSSPNTVGQQQRGDQQAPLHAPMATTTTTMPSAVATTFSEKIAAIIFLVHLFIAAVVILFLAVSGASSAHRPGRLIVWYRPLLASVPISLAFSLCYLLATLSHPSFTLQQSFWMSPILCLAAALLVLCTSTTAGDVFGPILFFLAAFLSLYSCWVSPRLSYASDLLHRSLAAVPPNSVRGLFFSTAIVAVVSAAWCAYWIIGIVAAVHRRMSAIYILALLAVLAWTMVVARILVHLQVVRAAGDGIEHGEGVRPRAALLHGAARWLGVASICALLSPAACSLRLLARAASKIARDDEFCFSCAGCYRAVMDRAQRNANEWGLVHVAVQGMPFRRAAVRAWESLARAGLSGVADTDLTRSMCFFSGVSGGAFCVLTVGAWTFATHRAVAASVSLFAFFIGYFMTRISMGWPQACVGAYHVMYAAYPGNPFFDSTIPDRLRQLQVATQV